MADEPKRPMVDEVRAQDALVAGEFKARDVYLGGSPPRPAAPPQKPPRNLPPRNDKFVGRGNELDEVHRRLGADRTVGITQQTAVHGHGGIGKSALVLEYAWRHLDDYPGGLLWIRCDTDLLLPEIAALAGPLGIEEAERPEQTAAWVKQHFEAGEPALLILDNVRDARQWADREWSRYLPAGNCRRLITTRDDRLPGVPMYRLERLPRDKGIELLAQYRADAREHDVVGDIVEWFDGLAVGLTVVGIYMADHAGLSWEDYGRHLDEKGLGTVRATEEAAGPLPDYDRRVDSVFDELVDSLTPAHRRGLEYAALLPEDTVLRVWLVELLAGDETIELPDLPGYATPAEGVAAELVDRRLLPPSAEDARRLSLHRVLRRRLRERLDESAELRETLLDRLAALGESRGRKSHDALTDKSLRGELSPLVELSEELRLAGRLDSAVSLANWVTAPLGELGRYAEVRRSLERFIDQSNSVAMSPEEHAPLLSNYALTLQRLGELGDARHNMESAIEINRKHLPENHPDLATTYSNLAMILLELGELGEARRNIEAAIRIERKHFPEDHPDLAVRYSNLAMILKHFGDLDDARQNMEAAIRIQRKHLPEDHPNLAGSYSNLAMVFKDLGELREARQNMEAAIRITQNHFAEDHPDLAGRYSNLAYIELEEGRHGEAKQLFLRASIIWRKHFPEDHPLIRMVAGMLRKLGVDLPGID